MDNAPVIRTIILQSWDTALGKMPEEFRQKLLQSAWQALPKASPVLKAAAQQVFAHRVDIRGFRRDKIFSAPFSVVKSSLLPRLPQDDLIAQIIVALWTEANSGQIMRFRAAALEQGVRLMRRWSFTDGVMGYETTRVEELLAIAETLAHDVDDRLELQLAAYWFSGAVLKEGEIDPLDEETLERPFEPVPETTSAEEIIPDAAASAGDAAEPVQPTSLSFDAWAENLTHAAERCREAQKAVKAQLKALQESVNVEQLARSLEQSAALQTAIQDWETGAADVRQVVGSGLDLLRAAIQARPDISMVGGWGVDFETLACPDHPIQETLEMVETCISRLHNYDSLRQGALNRLAESENHLQKLGERLQRLGADTEPAASSRSAEDGAETSPPALLTTALHDLSQRETRRRALDEQYQIIHQRLVEQVTTYARQIQQDEADAHEAMFEGIILAQLDTRLLQKQDAEWLQQCVAALQNHLEERIRQRQPVIPPLIEQLRADWSAANVTAVLDQLSREGRHVETFLLLVSLSYAQPEAQLALLPPETVTSMLHGLEQMGQGQEFDLLNLIAAPFLNIWQPGTEIEVGRLCFLGIAADCAAKQRLPEGCLWNLGMEWPLANMPTWARFWEALIGNPDFPALAAEVNPKPLNEARGSVEQMLVHEKGSFYKAHGLKSRRHYELMQKTLLPEMVRRKEELLAVERGIEKALADDTPYQLPHLLESMDHLLPTLDDDEITRWYDDEARSVGVEDREPFHRQSCLKILKSIGDSLFTYATAIRDTAQARQAQAGSISLDTLAKELDRCPELRSLGGRVLTVLARLNEASSSAWDEGTSVERAKRWLSHALLRDRASAQRLPVTVARLVNEDLPLGDWLTYLLQDLGEALSPAEAGELLLNAGAPSHALLFADLIALETQKGARTQEAERQREINQLEDELIKQGGELPDMREMREACRWGLLLQILQERLGSVQAMKEAQSQQTRRVARDLKNQIHDLENQLFDDVSIPADTRSRIERGLSIAEELVNDLRLLEDVKPFLEHVTYRLQHRSWSLAEIQSSVEGLAERAYGPIPGHAPTTSIPQTLSFLEQGFQRQLGISTSDELTPSEVNTRSDLLTLWQSLQQIKGFASANLQAKEVELIEKFISKFAVMVPMRRDPVENPIISRDPFPYSFWRLRYPRTSALDAPCVLLALPGSAVRPEDIRLLQETIDEKEWLEYCFVLVFMTGQAPQLRQRLEQNYMGSGLVVIGEDEILDMVLAERNSMAPTGRLRPRLLNAKKQLLPDIFQYDHLVENRLGIFTGRDKLVDGLSSSGNNFALYGGRRIGKSSILNAVKEKLERKGVQTIYHSFEGDKNCADPVIAEQLLRKMRLDFDPGAKDNLLENFKLILQEHLEAPDKRDVSYVLILDEIDRYIEHNPQRHLLIEALRTLSDQFSGRFRVIVAGFMRLYDCLKGRGPYTATSDPWQRMFVSERIGNLDTDEAEKIAREGFLEILGWRFKNLRIPQRIVEYTGGHPAFVQSFCNSLQRLVQERGDQTVTLEDLEAVFNNSDPNKDRSFIAYVYSTLKLNIDPVGQYVLFFLAIDAGEQRGFTFDQLRHYASLLKSVKIEDQVLLRSLEHLDASSVVLQRQANVYDFSVPDYPQIINRLTDTVVKLEELEKKDIPEHIRRAERGLA